MHTVLMLIIIRNVKEKRLKKYKRFETFMFRYMCLYFLTFTFYVNLVKSGGWWWWWWWWMDNTVVCDDENRGTVFGGGCKNVKRWWWWMLAVHGCLSRENRVRPTHTQHTPSYFSWEWDTLLLYNPFASWLLCCYVLDWWLLVTSEKRDQSSTTRRGGGGVILLLSLSFSLFVCLSCMYNYCHINIYISIIIGP